MNINSYIIRRAKICTALIDEKLQASIRRSCDKLKSPIRKAGAVTLFTATASGPFRPFLPSGFGQRLGRREGECVAAAVASHHVAALVLLDGHTALGAVVDLEALKNFKVDGVTLPRGLFRLDDALHENLGWAGGVC